MKGMGEDCRRKERRQLRYERDREKEERGQWIKI
jgi:hypothetical protein